MLNILLLNSFLLGFFRTLQHVLYKSAYTLHNQNTHPTISSGDTTRRYRQGRACAAPSTSHRRSTPAAAPTDGESCRWFNMPRMAQRGGGEEEHLGRGSSSFKSPVVLDIEKISPTRRLYTTGARFMPASSVMRSISPLHHKSFPRLKGAEYFAEPRRVNFRFGPSTFVHISAVRLKEISPCGWIRNRRRLSVVITRR